MIIFLTGLIGSIILVLGAAWPDYPKLKPIKSVKSWFFAIGALIMFIYSILGYIQGEPLFFVILELLIIIASIMMMLNLPDKIDVPVILTSSAALIIWALFLFEGYLTIIFILGLCGVGLGYTLEANTKRRNLALTVGSALIAWFSYLESSWIFFWLNLFFAMFSLYYLYKSYENKID